MDKVEMEKFIEKEVEKVMDAAFMRHFELFKKWAEPYFAAIRKQQQDFIDKMDRDFERREIARKEYESWRKINIEDRRMKLLNTR